MTVGNKLTLNSDKTELVLGRWSNSQLILDDIMAVPEVYRQLMRASGLGSYSWIAR